MSLMGLGFYRNLPKVPSSSLDDFAFELKTLPGLR
jgi:hypothetical protein